jgi:prepilin-type N-terminal cleavage/methylation domain-containing protein
MSLNHANKSAFTLIEVIVSIVITAVLAAMLVVLMGRSLTKSSDPVISLKNEYDLQKVIENMATFTTNNLLALQTSIGTEGSSQSNTFFGAYQVVYNRFIVFNSGTETSGGTNILKVTIRNAGGDRLTRLFCR